MPLFFDIIKHIILSSILLVVFLDLCTNWGPPWSWSYGGWVSNYLCNLCLSLLTLWVRTLLRRGVLDTILCDNVCQWLVAGGWFSPGTPVSSTYKTDRNNINEVLLKVALNTITITPIILFSFLFGSLSWPLY